MYLRLVMIDIRQANRYGFSRLRERRHDLGLE